MGKEALCSLAESTKNFQHCDTWEGVAWVSLMRRLVPWCVGVSWDSLLTQ